MIIFVNGKNEIKDVGETQSKGLIKLEIDDEVNPFKGWSNAKICCYKATVIEGRVTMMTPYVTSTLIEHVDQLGKRNDANTEVSGINSSDISDTMLGLTDTFEATSDNTDDITDLQMAIAEIYELVSK